MNRKAILVIALLMVGATGACAQGESAMSASPAPSLASPGSSGPDQSPTAAPSPTPQPISSDDLTDALPTNPMLSKVQGSTFKEAKRWRGGGDEGPEWVADAPLSKKQRYQIGVGALRRVKPDRCEAMAVFWASGWTTKWSGSDYLTGAGYTKKVNSNPYYSRRQVADWITVAYMLRPGSAAVWTDNVAATVKSCGKFTQIKANGDISKISLAPSRGYRVAWLRWGTAVARRVSSSQAGGMNYTYTISEPIGNVLYWTYIWILGADRAELDRASALYNRLADNLAKAQGIEREPISLRDGTRLTPDPSLYQAPLAADSNSA